MSILIKGMEKPKECDDCPLCGYDERESILFCRIDKEDIVQDLRDDCPLIEIPTPHGRLIDADALFQDLREHSIPFNNDINSAINVAPTILEAEE